MSHFCILDLTRSLCLFAVIATTKTVEFEEVSSFFSIVFALRPSAQRDDASHKMSNQRSYGQKREERPTSQMLDRRSVLSDWLKVQKQGSNALSATKHHTKMSNRALFGLEIAFYELEWLVSFELGAC